MIKKKINLSNVLGDIFKVVYVNDVIGRGIIVAEWLARRVTVRFIRGSNPGPSPTQGCLNVLDAGDNVRSKWLPREGVPLDQKK